MKEETDMKKSKWILILAASIAAACPVTAFADWGQDEKGYWYQYDSGEYARNQITAINGVNYAFNQEAYMVEGWHSTNSGWYYFDPATGAQVMGWLQLGDTWYYLNPQNGGLMQTSWLDIGKKRYYFEPGGAMQTGKFIVGGYAYMAEADGSIRRNQSYKQDGITLRWDEEGRTWYRNEENDISHMNGGETWLPYLEDQALAEQRREIQANNSDFVEQRKDELAEEFKEDLTRAKKESSRKKAIERWKEKANKKLAELAVPQADIDSFVSLVLKARYGGDRGNWTYTYTDDNGVEYTYEYWISDDTKKDRLQQSDPYSVPDYFYEDEDEEEIDGNDENAWDGWDDYYSN